MTEPEMAMTMICSNGFDRAQVKAAHVSPRLILTCSSSLRMWRSGDRRRTRTHLPSRQATRKAARDSWQPATTQNPKSGTKKKKQYGPGKTRRKSRKRRTDTFTWLVSIPQHLADQAPPSKSRRGHGELVGVKLIRS